MTAADELRTAAASIRAGDTPADPDKFLDAVADWLDLMTYMQTARILLAGSAQSQAAVAVARAWNADLP